MHNLLIYSSQWPKLLEVCTNNLLPMVRDYRLIFSNLSRLSWNSVKVGFFEHDTQKAGSISNFITWP